MSCWSIDNFCIKILSFPIQVFLETWLFFRQYQFLSLCISDAAALLSLILILGIAHKSTSNTSIILIVFSPSPCCTIYQFTATIIPVNLHIILYASFYIFIPPWSKQQHKISINTIVALPRKKTAHLFHPEPVLAKKLCPFLLVMSSSYGKNIIVHSKTNHCF